MKSALNSKLTARQVTKYLIVGVCYAYVADVSDIVLYGRKRKENITLRVKDAVIRTACWPADMVEQICYLKDEARRVAGGAAEDRTANRTANRADEFWLDEATEACLGS